MTITAADIKIGMCIEMDGKTFLVVDFQHCKPGKGPAFVRSKLKNLENGRVLENTFSSVSQKIEQVRVERRPYQFTYEDDLGELLFFRAAKLRKKSGNSYSRGHGPLQTPAERPQSSIALHLRPICRIFSSVRGSA